MPVAHIAGWVNPLWGPQRFQIRGLFAASTLYVRKAVVGSITAVDIEAMHVVRRSSRKQASDLAKAQVLTLGS
jgi:hypothetical protein